MKLHAERRLQRVGGSLYCPIPRRALLELRLFAGDWCDWELDTDTRTLTLRPKTFRTIVPMVKLRSNDMASDVPGPPEPNPRELPADVAPMLVESAK